VSKSNDGSFTVAAASSDNHAAAAIDESDINISSDDRLNQTLPNDNEISCTEFQVIEGGTKRDKPKLVDKNGYTYNVKKRFIPNN